MNNNPGILNKSRNQASYLEILEGESLFLSAKRPICSKPIINILILKKRQTEEKTVNLIDLEEAGGIKNIDIKMEEVHQDHKDQEVQDPIVQNQEKDKLAEPLEVNKEESLK
ncbi:24117_t:CDS:1, partial [Racocetra persica]